MLLELERVQFGLHAAHLGAQNTGNRQEAPTTRFLVITVLLIVSILIYEIQFFTAATAPTIGII